MPVDFTKEPHILAVHGVQHGDNDDIDSDAQIEKLVKRSMNKKHIKRNFLVHGYLYEDINDDAQSIYQMIGKAITSGNVIAQEVFENAIDLIGDVVIAVRNTSTAAKVRKGLKDKILESYESGNPLLVVAHSLGTVYCLDVISELMSEHNYFKGDDSSTWPVQGYITLGSPLGLEINVMEDTIFPKRNIATLKGADYRLFPWHNYYNRLDPIVSGNVFGAPLEIKGSKGPVEKRYGADTKQANWLLQGHAVTSGKQWLLAHTAYWKNTKIGDKITDMLWG